MNVNRIVIFAILSGISEISNAEQNTYLMRIDPMSQLSYQSHNQTLFNAWKQNFSKYTIGEIIAITLIPVTLCILVGCIMKRASLIQQNAANQPGLTKKLKQRNSNPELLSLMSEDEESHMGVFGIETFYDANALENPSYFQSCISYLCYPIRCCSKSIQSPRQFNSTYRNQNFIQHSNTWFGFLMYPNFKRKFFWWIIGAIGVALSYTFSFGLYVEPSADPDGFLLWNVIYYWTPLQMGLLIMTILMIWVYFLPMAYLKPDFEAGKKFRNDPNFLKKIGVVIPCHRSAREVGNVARKVLKYIPPENIIVVDNDDTDWPMDNTLEVIKSLHPRIRYCFIKQAHKARAIWTGVHRLPTSVEYILHLDDDTVLSDYMVFDENHFLGDNNEDFVVAVGYMRCVNKDNRLTKFTDFWYKFTDHFHATQGLIGSRCYVPGTASLWRRSKFVEIFSQHPAFPFGEDIFAGFIALNNGYAMRTEMRCQVNTNSPTILTTFWSDKARITRAQGYAVTSLWKQRASRWTLSSFRIVGKSLYSFFTYDTRSGYFSNLAFRLYRFREYKIIICQLLYFPLSSALLFRFYLSELVLLQFLVFLIPLLRSLYVNYYCWKNQPELQVDFETVLLSPFYNYFLIICAIWGRWSCLLNYIPNVAPNYDLLQLTKPRPLSHVKTDVSPYSMELNTTGDDRKKNRSSRSSRNGSSGRNSSSGHENNNLLMTLSLEDRQSLAETLLTELDDTFELFEIDGSSCVTIYSTKPPSHKSLTPPASTATSMTSQSSSLFNSFLLPRTSFLSNGSLNPPSNSSGHGTTMNGYIAPMHINTNQTSPTMTNPYPNGSNLSLMNRNNNANSISPLSSGINNA